MSYAKPALLMIHGVNSTLEWSEPAMRALKPHFECHEVRYRYFHTIWGPIKVYIWPTALLLAINCILITVESQLGEGSASVLRSPKWGAWPGWAWIIIASLLVVEGFIATKGEWIWTKKANEQAPIWFPPIFLPLAGLITALLLPSPNSFVFAIAALVSTSFFLDLREYSDRREKAATGELSSIGLTLVWLGICFVLVVLFLFWFEGMSLSYKIYSIAAILGVGFFETFIRKDRAFKRMQSQINEVVRDYPKPFVIAHSLGTFLIGHSMREIESLNLGRVILTGCVLERRFAWQIATDQTRGADFVVNYIGRRDLVPFLTGSLRFIWYWLTFPLRLVLQAKGIAFFAQLINWRSLGSAGIFGFVNDRETVHTFKPNGICPTCETGEVARVHNIDVGWASHSSINRKTEFHNKNWLPQLWGMTGEQFLYWQNICQRGCYFSPTEEYPIPSEDFQQCEKELRKYKWSWPTAATSSCIAPRRILSEYVKEILVQIEENPNRTDELMRRIPSYLFKIVETARLAAFSNDDEGSDAVSRLHPQSALKHAVLLALRQ